MRPFILLLSLLLTQSTSPGQDTQRPVNKSTQRVPVSQVVSSGLLLHHVQPTYPPVARQARIQGSVELHAEISKDGSIQSLSLISGHPLLVPSAIEAVKQWRYKPYILNGEPVEVETTVTINFLLAGEIPASAAGSNAPLKAERSVSQVEPPSPSTGEKSQAMANGYDKELDGAVALLQSHKMAEAMQAAVKLIASDPGRWEGYGLEGAIERAENKLSDAKAAYQRALSLAPDDSKSELARAIQEIDKQIAPRR
jgi:TonB family protein